MLPIYAPSKGEENRSGNPARAESFLAIIKSGFHQEQPRSLPNHFLLDSGFWILDSGFYLQDKS
jgi:hypothetical protein